MLLRTAYRFFLRLLLHTLLVYLRQYTVLLLLLLIQNGSLLNHIQLSMIIWTSIVAAYWSLMLISRRRLALCIGNSYTLLEAGYFSRYIDFLIELWLIIFDRRRWLTNLSVDASFHHVGLHHDLLLSRHDRVLLCYYHLLATISSSNFLNHLRFSRADLVGLWICHFYRRRASVLTVFDVLEKHLIFLNCVEWTSPLLPKVTYLSYLLLLIVLILILIK